MNEYTIDNNIIRLGNAILAYKTSVPSSGQECWLVGSGLDAGLQRAVTNAIVRSPLQTEKVSRRAPVQVECNAEILLELIKEEIERL